MGLCSYSRVSSLSESSLVVLFYYISSKPVGLFSQADCQIYYHAFSFLPVDDLTHQQTSHPVSGCTPPDVMPGGDRQECTRIIVKPGRVIHAGCFHHLVEITAHAIPRVVEPPGWTELHSRVA